MGQIQKQMPIEIPVASKKKTEINLDTNSETHPNTNSNINQEKPKIHKFTNKIRKQIIKTHIIQKNQKKLGNKLETRKIFFIFSKRE